MKNVYLILMLIATILCGCTERNVPSNPGGGNGGNNVGNGGSTKVTVDFTYQLVSPFCYKFTNKSQGADSYKWDFGDGSFSSADKETTHQYKATGTYIVTLTGTKGNEKTDCRKQIVVKKPSIYIAGYTLYKIPYENKYYKVVCKDDDLFTTNWGFTTVYTPLLDKTDLPYIKYFSSPLLMDKLDGDNYYTFYVYYTTNTSSTSGDTQCLKQKLQKTEILKYEEEYILTSDNGQTQLGIIMEYQ